jgi:hypothetical protein
MEQATQDELVNLLASMGGALGGKGSWQEAAGGWAKGRVQSRNYAAMLQKLLAGMPAGTEMKAGAGADGKMTFSIPTANVTENQHLPGFSSDVGNVNPFVEQRPGSVGGVVSPTPAPAPTAPAPGGGFVNPSSSLPSTSGVNLAGLNLAGLTPENITQALQLQHSQQQIGLAGETLGINKGKFAMEQRSEPYDLMAKMAQVQHLQAQAKKLAQGEPLDRPYPVPVPGVGVVSQRQWEHIPDKDRSYALYAFQAKQLGSDAKIMSKSEWETYTPTDHIKMLRQMQVDPQLMDMEMKLRQAGATNIDLGIAKKQAMNKLEGESYFSDPKWTKDIESHMGTEDVKQKVFDASSSSKNKDKTVRAAENKKAESLTKFKETSSYIENKIKAGGGEIIDLKYSSDKRTLVWTVKWPSGATTTVKHDVPGIDEAIKMYEANKSKK